MSRFLLIAALSYLLGSIPFGYLLVHIFRGEDVRNSGSGNIGATNVSRKSPALGVVTLLLDALKGSIAVTLASALAVPMENGNCQATSLAALAAVVGHVFPIWLRFRGGKGVATGLGAFALIAPQATLMALGIFVVIVLLFRYVSLASIMAVAAFPPLVWGLHQYGQSWSAFLLMSLAALLIVLKHHENIRRLVAGTENRIGTRRERK